MKRIEEEEKENNERWLLTYSDLITLLMIFFVIMYAYSSISSVKYNALSKSLNAVLGSGGANMIASGQGSIIDFGSTGGTSDSGNNSSTALTTINTDAGMSNLEDELNQYLTDNGLGDYAAVYIDERGVGIRFKDSVLFESGKADVKGNLKGIIAKIGSILSKDDNYIRVEGHTDNIPINNAQFKSNWQLSSVRAANVAQLLIEESGIAPQKISAVGYGEYRPIADNSTADGRAKNRRVDIVLINSKFNAVESNQ